MFADARITPAAEQSREDIAGKTLPVSINANSRIVEAGAGGRLAMPATLRSA